MEHTMLDLQHRTTNLHFFKLLCVFLCFSLFFEGLKRCRAGLGIIDTLAADNE
jgi:hypothetical protein